MASRYLQKFPIPDDFSEILRDFTREILRFQPKDIIDFGVKYFGAYEKQQEFVWGQVNPDAPLPCDYPKPNVQGPYKTIKPRTWEEIEEAERNPKPKQQVQQGKREVPPQQASPRHEGGVLDILGEQGFASLMKELAQILQNDQRVSDHFSQVSEEQLSKGIHKLFLYFLGKEQWSEELIINARFNVNQSQLQVIIEIIVWVLTEHKISSHHVEQITKQLKQLIKPQKDSSNQSGVVSHSEEQKKSTHQSGTVTHTEEHKTVTHSEYKQTVTHTTTTYTEIRTSSNVQYITASSEQQFQVEQDLNTMSLDSDEDQAASIYTDELVKNAEREAKVREHVSYLR